MAIGAIAAAAGGSILGNILSGALNSTYEWEDRNWRSQSDYEDYREERARDIENYFLDKQLAYNTYMSNTAYQRAVKDMEAAGLNPASMSGVSAQSASSPTAPNVHNSYSTNARMNTSPYNLLEGNLISSAICSAIAKDHDAAKLMASELVDNARHAHRLEEMREKHELTKMDRLVQQDERESKAHYYTSKANMLDDIRFNKKY